MPRTDQPAPRHLSRDASIIDDPRVDARTLALALRAFGRAVYFEGRTCKGAGKRDRNGRLPGCVQGHAKRCRGGRDYWYLLSYKGFAAEVLGTGATPRKALEDATRKRAQRAEHYARLARESRGEVS